MTLEVFSVLAGQKAARRARHELDRFVGRDVPDIIWRARLCLTELVANAVVHGSLTENDEIEVAVRRRRGALRVDLRYPGRGFTVDSGLPKDGGRGLELVNALADEWGSSELDGHVWFELAVAAEARAPLSV